MAGKRITRAELAAAVYEQADMTKGVAADLVDQVLEAMGRALARGESVKLSSFGVFRVRERAPRIGRNPKTNVAVPIAPRRAILFSPSPRLIAKVNQAFSSPCGSEPQATGARHEPTA